MKKSLLSHCSNLLTLLFLAAITPIIFSGGADAQTTSGCTFTAATGTAPNITAATCTGNPSDGGPACNSRPATSDGCTTPYGVNVTADANNNAFVSTMCSALKIVTGNGGKAFAAFAIISMGIGFFTGKVSWGLMIGIAAGIAAMFGAPTIVAAISGGSAYDCGS